MANKELGQIELQVGEKTYLLQFTANAMCNLESRLPADTGSQEFLAALDSKARTGRARMTDLRLLIWAGLTENHPEITEAAAGQIITAIGGIAPTMQKMGEALGAASPDAVAGDAGNVAAAAVS